MTLRCEASVLGWRIRAEAVRLDEGWDVSVFGGCRTHVGAVTVAEVDGCAQTLLRTNHRDDAVSERWARTLAQAWRTPVCVRAGIHYDDIGKAEIEAVLRACDDLLKAIMERKKTDVSHE